MQKKILLINRFYNIARRNYFKKQKGLKLNLKKIRHISIIQSSLAVITIKLLRKKENFMLKVLTRQE